MLFSYRKHRVVANGSESDWSIVDVGLPQVAVLGPFFIYINGLEEGIKSKVKFFADDTSLFSIVRIPNTTAGDQNHDVNLVNQCPIQWKMSFNPDPNKQAFQLIFSIKGRKNYHLKICINKFEVTRECEHKHLGFILDFKLSFASRINEKINTERKGLGIIKHLSLILPVSTLDQIYVLPHLDFSDIIFRLPKKLNEFDSSILLNNLIFSVERIQYQADLAITGVWSTSFNKNYEELGWKSITDGRWCRRLVQFYKIYNKIILPHIWNHLFHHQGIILYGTRSNNSWHVIPCKQNNIQAWNDIGSNLRNAQYCKTY